MFSVFSDKLKMIATQKFCFLFFAAFSFVNAGAIVMGDTECIIVDPKGDESLELKGLEKNSDYQVKRCESLEPRGYIYYLSDKPRSTDRGYCVYTEVRMRDTRRFNMSVLSQEGCFNMIAEGVNGECPDTTSKKYLNIGEVHKGDDKEEIYLALIRLLEKFEDDEKSIDEALSSLPLLEKIFSSEDNQFKDQLIGKQMSDTGKGVVIEFIQRSKKGYTAAFRIDKTLWILDLYLNDGVFDIDGISSARP